MNPSDIAITLSAHEQTLLLANEHNDPDSWADLARKIRQARSAGRLQTVTFHWHTRYGPCEDCGLPSAYLIDGNSESALRTCSVCAAEHAAGGSHIARLDSTL